MNLHATRQNYRLGQLSSAKCQAFYAAPDAVPAAAYDAALGAYRPDPTSARPPYLVSRPFTYEDTRLAGWSAPTSPASDHVLPLWVGTAQRAVKAFSLSLLLHHLMRHLVGASNKIVFSSSLVLSKTFSSSFHGL